MLYTQWLKPASQWSYLSMSLLSTTIEMSSSTTEREKNTSSEDLNREKRDWLGLHFSDGYRGKTGLVNQGSEFC